jgi:hypothetical protein
MPRTFVIGLLLILIFVNLYFRLRVLKYYKKLKNTELPLRSRHIFDRQKLEKEILSVHGPDRENIKGFVDQIRRMIIFVAILFVIIVGLSLFTALQD